MNPICVVQRGRAIGQFDDLTCWRVNLNQIDVENLLLDGVHELLRVGAGAFDPEEFLETLHRPHVRIGSFVIRRAIFIRPMGSHTFLGETVHRPGADLHLQRLAIRSSDVGVDRLVAVHLGPRYVVVVTSGDRFPEPVDDSEGGVTGLLIVNDDAKRDQVMDVVKRTPLRFVTVLFLIDAVEVLCPSADGRIDASLLYYCLCQNLNGSVCEPFAHVSLLFDEALHRCVAFGIQLLERHVLHAPLNVIHSQSLGKRCEDLKRFACSLLATRPILLERQSLHIVRAVCELYQEHAEVFAGGCEHLAQAGDTAAFALVRMPNLGPVSPRNVKP